MRVSSSKGEAQELEHYMPAYKCSRNISAEVNKNENPDERKESAEETRTNAEDRRENEDDFTDEVGFDYLEIALDDDINI
mgnify:CR=1 FL=1